MAYVTVFDFTLPRGYLSIDGSLHRHGRMRLAIALDEIEAVSDPRVQANEAYLPLILLSRVITELGELREISPQLAGNLFASDLSYLEDLYLRINGTERITIGATCPHCSKVFQLQVAPVYEDLQME